MAEPENSPELVEDDLEAKLKALEDAEKAIDNAYTTGKADRAKITQAAQLDAAEAVAMAGIAMEADDEADEAMRISVIAENSGDRAKIKQARLNEREARKKAKAEHRAATKSAKRAYDAIKFSAPNKMGFMRVVQVIFAIHIAGVLVFLIMTSRDRMVYDISSMMDWAMVVLESVAFWMFINRYRLARPFVIAMAAVGLVVPAIYDIVTGQFSPFMLIANGEFYIFLILYFALSKRVKAVLVNDFSQHKGDYEKDSFVIQRKGWPFVRNLIMYFIIFSILGHWMEMGMCQFIIMGIVQGEYDPSNTMLWRDWLYPFPMEGAAVVIIALALYPLFMWMKKKIKNRLLPYVLSFVANALVCSVIEFSMGLLVNADLQLWNYTDNFGNIMGQVCLQNTMAFGVAASLIAWFVYPLLERWIARVPRDIMNIVFVVVVAFGALVWSLYLINPPGVDEPISAQQEAKAKADYDRLVLSAQLLSLADDLKELEATLDKAETVDKAKVQGEIDEIRAQMEIIMKKLDIEKLPEMQDAISARLMDAVAKPQQQQ